MGVQWPEEITPSLLTVGWLWAAQVTWGGTCFANAEATQNSAFAPQAYIGPANMWEESLSSPQFRWTQKHLRQSQRCKDTPRYSAWLGPVATCQGFACRLAHKSLHYCIHGKSHLPQTPHTAKLLGSALSVCHPMAMGHGTSFRPRQNTGWNRPQWVS